MRAKDRNRSLEMAMIGMFSAIAFLMELLSVSVPFLPAFLKLDISDVPGLIATFAMGMQQGILVCLIKNMLHLLCSTSGGVGELCNFLMGLVLVTVSGALQGKRRSKTAAMTGSVIAAVAVSLSSVVLNFYLVYPVYIRVMGLSEAAILSVYRVVDPGIRTLSEALLKFNMPFTFVKAILNLWLGSFVYKRILPVQRGMR